MKKVYLFILIFSLAIFWGSPGYTKSFAIKLSKDGRVGFFQCYNCIVIDAKMVEVSNRFEEKYYTCPIPEKLIKAYKNFSKEEPLFIAPETVRKLYSKKYDRYEFNHEFLLKMKIGQVDYISGDVEGKYVDIARVDLKLVKAGRNWSILSSKVYPKYQNQKPVGNYGIAETFFSSPHGNVSLFNPIGSLKNIKLISQPIKDDPIMGEYELDEIKISVSNYRISSITVSDIKHKTYRGLKVGDTKEKALQLYGLPDVGYYEDNTWGYYFFRDWLGDGTSTVISDDDFKIYFKNNRVIKFVLNAYIPID